MSEQIKKCRCCGREWTVHQFLRLMGPAGGRQDMHFEEGGVRWRLVMRQCKCHSTLAIELRTSCEAAGCSLDVKDCGYCAGHSAQRRRGQAIRPLTPKAFSQSDMRPHCERFEELMSPEPNTGCTLWLGANTEQGYGRYQMPKSGGYAHRAALLIFVGEPAAGKPYALHSCDNRWCVNPAHLRWGTQKENAEEARDRGRSFPSGVKGEQHGMAKLTAAQVDEIRGLLAQHVNRKLIAQRFGVSVSTIHLIARGKVWRGSTSTIAIEMPTQSVAA